MPSTTETTAQMRRAVAPMQQFGGMIVDSVGRFSEFQFEVMQNYTRFTIDSMRGALNVHDAQSLRDYLQSQARASEEFARKMASDTQNLMQVGQEMGRESLRVVGSSAAQTVQTAQTAQREASETAERAATETKQGIPDGYDDMTVAEIEQRLPKFDLATVERLLEYEQKHKNRKRLHDAFTRRLQEQ